MSWKKEKLGNVITQRKQFITIEDSIEYKRCRVQVNRKGVVVRDVVKGIEINTKKQQLCKEGDFLVAEIDAKVGGYGFVGKELEGAIVSSHYFLFEINETQLLKDYLAWLIKTDIIQDQIASKGSTNYAAIRPQHVLNFEIPLPSMEKQREIIDKLNTINAEYLLLDNKLTQQQTYLQLLRQTILQEAVQGKLTKTNPTDEPATALLQRIKKEKEKLNSSGASARSKKEKELPPITEDEIPFALPEGWVWCRLGELGQINPRNVFEDEREVSFVPMTLISSNYGAKPKQEIRKWKEVKNAFTHLAENDVAIAKITPCFENSKAAIFKNLVNGIGAGTTELHVFRGNIDYISPNFVYLFFKSIHFLKQGESKMTGSAGQKRVPTDYIKTCLFPLPPLPEQQRIIAKVQSLQQHINELENKAKQNLHYAQQLLQTVLSEAFKVKKEYEQQEDHISGVAEINTVYEKI